MENKGKKKYAKSIIHLPRQYLPICHKALIYKGFLGIVYLYGKDVQERVGKLGLVTFIVSSIILFIPLFMLVPYMVYRVNGVTDFTEGFIQMTMILIIMGLFDRFFIGWYWIGHTKAWFIPKTEDLKPYIPLSKDYLDFILEELSELEEAIYYMVVNLAEYRGDGNL